MDIFEFALKMEKDGAEFYRELAQKTGSQPLQEVLGLLADEEDKHYRAIEAIVAEKHDMPQADILDSAKNVFQRAKEFGDPLTTETDQVGLYNQALELERKSEAFYLDRADQVKLPRQKELFQQFAAEEAKHIVLLENMIEFVTRPQHWLENAEFFHPDEY